MAQRAGEPAELNIGAGTQDGPIEHFTATLLHEMVHLWNIHEGIQDCSRGGQYHNKRFRDAAISRNLDISYDERIGWSITEPTPELCDFIIEQGWTDIDMSRIEWSFTSRGKGTGNTTGGIDAPTGRTSRTAGYLEKMFRAMKEAVGRKKAVAEGKCEEADFRNWMFEQGRVIDGIAEAES